MASCRTVPSTGPAPSTLRSAARTGATARPTKIAVRIESAVRRMVVPRDTRTQRLLPIPRHGERAHARTHGKARPGRAFRVAGALRAPPIRQVFAEPALLSVVSADRRAATPIG